MAEQGRRNGVLPGFIAREPSGRIVGWSFFSVERGSVHIGAVDSDRAEVVRDLHRPGPRGAGGRVREAIPAFLFPSERRPFASP